MDLAPVRDYFSGLQARIVAALEQLDGKAFAAEGARFVPMTSEQFGSFVKAEIAKWAPVVKASGAKAD